jgi:1-acyl-sn-glycerol-3-phosphate acyltransferase
MPGSLGYALVRALVRLLLALFYRRIEVTGAERFPPDGALIVAANHHNSLVDAMLLIAVTPRRLRTLANAPLFRHPLIGPFLRLLGALPVHRRQEAGDDPARNMALFRAISETLRDGGAILIFPEGRTQPEPALLTLRTGAARMLLAAEAAGSGPVTLLPVGLVYQDPATFRAARALVLVGPPVATADVVARHGSAPEAAVRALTERLTEALRRQIVEADDWDTLRLLGLVETVWREETAAPAADTLARVAWMQRVMRAYRDLRAREPERIDAFRRRVEVYAGELERIGGGPPAAAYPPGVVARFAVREGLSLLVGTPLALWGIASHIVPYQLTRVVVRWLHRTAEEEATDKIAVGSVLYPLCWALEAWGVARLGGGGAAALFLAALLPTGFFALAWRERLDRVGRETRAFLFFVADRDLPRRLGARRAALAAEFAGLARRVTEEPRREPSAPASGG